MVQHIRKIYWTSDGWPVVSPERYAATDLAPPLSINELLGDWEYISLGYRVVPGYDKEQVSPDFQIATKLTLAADGTFNGDVQNKWTFTAPNLELKWSTGTIVNRFFPSSKTCSSCGEIKATLKLSERIFKCGACGYQADRDLNAAYNLEKKAVSYTVSACGVSNKQIPPSNRGKADTVKQEANISLVQDCVSFV